MNQCRLYRSCAVGSALEHSPVTRAAGVRNPVEAWNFRIISVNAHAQYGKWNSRTSTWRAKDSGSRTYIHFQNYNSN